MRRKILFYSQAVLLVAIAVVHAFSLAYDLYWFYPLLNRVVHFAGGLWVALALMWLFAYRAREARFGTVLALVLFVSVAWEIFEVAIGMTHEENYALDTSLDLIMDLLGGSLGFMIARRLARAEIPRDTIVEQ